MSHRESLQCHYLTNVYKSHFYKVSLKNAFREKCLRILYRFLFYFLQIYTIKHDLIISFNLKKIFIII